MLITTPEFTLIELNLVSDVSGRGSRGRGGYKFNIPRSTERQQASIHRYQNQVQSVGGGGSRLIVQSVSTAGRLGSMRK